MHHLKDCYDSLGFVDALHRYNSDLKQICVGQRVLADAVGGCQTWAERIAGVIANMSQDDDPTGVLGTPLCSNIFHSEAQRSLAMPPPSPSGPFQSIHGADRPTFNAGSTGSRFRSFSLRRSGRSPTASETLDQSKINESSPGLTSYEGISRLLSGSTFGEALDATSSGENSPAASQSELEMQPMKLFSVSGEDGDEYKDDVFVLDQPTYHISDIDELISRWTK